MMIAFEAVASITSGSLTLPMPVWTTLTRMPSSPSRSSDVDQRFDRTLDVGLDDQIQLANLAGRDPAEQVLELDLRSGRLPLGRPLTLSGGLAGRLLVRHVWRQSSGHAAGRRLGRGSRPASKARPSSSACRGR